MFSDVLTLYIAGFVPGGPGVLHIILTDSGGSEPVPAVEDLGSR